jgi:hypothetical protein
MPKTLYHSALVKLGPVKVTVKSDVTDSKFPGKPPFVTLEIGGESFNYNTESDECAAFFEGSKGKTFHLVAEGSGKDGTAKVSYVGGTAGAEKPAAPARGVARKGMAAHNTGVPPGHPGHAPHPAAAARPPGQTAPVKPRNGAMVGACVNKAVDYMIAEGVPYNAEEVANRASDLVRIAESLESGHLRPKYSERHPAQQ